MVGLGHGTRPLPTSGRGGHPVNRSDLGHSYPAPSTPETPPVSRPATPSTRHISAFGTGYQHQLAPAGFTAITIAGGDPVADGPYSAEPPNPPSDPAIPGRRPGPTQPRGGRPEPRPSRRAGGAVVSSVGRRNGDAETGPGDGTERLRDPAADPGGYRDIADDRAGAGAVVTRRRILLARLRDLERRPRPSRRTAAVPVAPVSTRGSAARGVWVVGMPAGVRPRCSPPVLDTRSSFTLRSRDQYIER